MLRDRKNQNSNSTGQSSVQQSKDIHQSTYEAYMKYKKELEESEDLDETENTQDEVSINDVLPEPEQIEVKVQNKNNDYDFVNHPKSYTNHIIETKSGPLVYETIEYLESLAKRLSQWLEPDEVYNVVSGAKYLDGIRGEKPDGDKTPRQKIAEDCEKIAWYLHRASWLIKENDKSKEI